MNQIFCTSPRNSVAAQVSLFKTLKVKAILCPNPRPPPVTAILEAYQLPIDEIPSVSALLEKDYPHYDFAKTYPEALAEPLLAV